MVDYTGVNHLAMATGDLDTTIRFWRDLLGMRMVAGYGSLGYRHYFFEISPTDMIAFFEWPGVRPKNREPSEVMQEGSEPQPGKWPPAKVTPKKDRRLYPGAGSEHFHGIEK